MTETITRRPTRVGVYLSVGFALLVTVLALPFSGPGVILGGFGLGIVVAATMLGSRRLVDVAGLALLFSVVAIAMEAPSVKGNPVAGLAVLGGAVGAVMAWDVAGNAIDVGEQLGRSADTVRGEGSHALASLAVGGFVSVVAYGIFQGASGGQPVTALVFMLVAMLVLVSALRL